MRLPTVNQLKMQDQVLSAQYEQLARLQTQASTGKNLVASSDAPFLADKIKSTKNYMEQLKSYELNLTMAESRVNQKTNITTNSIDLINRSSELMVYAQNETMTNDNRVVIAEELQGILNQLYSLANTQSVNGEYVFSGFSINTPPFTKQGSSYSYQGSSETVQIDIGPETRINYSDSGYKVFGAIPQGDGLIYADSNRALNTGTGVISDAAVINGSQYVADNYTLSLVTNSQGQQGYVITGATTGQVIPAPPLTSPANAPQLIPGQPIQFNGMRVVITGAPVDGDKFSIAPSQNQNIFTTLANVIQVLQTPVSTDKSKADLKQQLINNSQSLIQASQHFIAYETQLGNTGKVVDNQKILSENLLGDQEVLLSELSDADLVSVLSSLTRQMTIIQLTQETYMKIQQSFYSLFNKG